MSTLKWKVLPILKLWLVYYFRVKKENGQQWVCLPSGNPRHDKYLANEYNLVIEPEINFLLRLYFPEKTYKLNYPYQFDTLLYKMVEAGELDKSKISQLSETELGSYELFPKHKIIYRLKEDKLKIDEDQYRYLSQILNKKDSAPNVKNLADSKSKTDVVLNNFTKFRELMKERWKIDKEIEYLFFHLYHENIELKNLLKKK